VDRRPCGIELHVGSASSRSKRAKVARWRVQRSLVVPVQLFLSEQLIPILFSGPVANHALNELCRPAGPTRSAATLARVRGVRLGLMPLPELSQGIAISVSTSECGGHLLLVLAAMATRNGEGVHPTIPMLCFPSDHCGRIARISLGVVHACSADGLVGRQATAVTSGVRAVRTQGSGYRSVVGLRLHVGSHHVIPNVKRVQSNRVSANASLRPDVAARTGPTSYLALKKERLKGLLSCGNACG
jgi:hypothetical protein